MKGQLVFLACLVPVLPEGSTEVCLALLLSAACSTTACLCTGCRCGGGAALVCSGVHRCKAAAGERRLHLGWSCLAPAPRQRGPNGQVSPAPRPCTACCCCCCTFAVLILRPCTASTDAVPQQENPDVPGEQGPCESTATGAVNCSHLHCSCCERRCTEVDGVPRQTYSAM